MKYLSIIFLIVLSSISCIEQDCEDTLQCECELHCPENFECRFKSDGEKNDQLCVLRNDIECVFDFHCPVDSICLNNSCEELLCLNQCLVTQKCVIYPDTNAVQCID